MSTLTIELLECMLSPDAGRRRSAEAAYGDIRRPDRLRGLTSILLHILPIPPSSSDIGGIVGDRRDDCDGDGRGTMAAVLLRREIGAPLDGITADTAASMVEIADPLLALFRRMGGGGGSGAGSGSTANGSARRQLGHCIAELCRALSSGAMILPAGLHDDDGGRGWMRTVLTNLGPGVSLFSVCVRCSLVGTTHASRFLARVSCAAPRPSPRSLSPFFFPSLLFRLVPFFPPSMKHTMIL